MHRGSSPFLSASTLEDPGYSTLEDPVLVVDPDIENKLKDVRADSTVVCLGDWNDPGTIIPFFCPFKLCRIPLKTVRVGCSQPLPKTCCSTAVSAKKILLYVGDYVLSNRTASNKVAIQESILQAYDASDNFPVLGTIKINSEQKVPDPEQLVQPPLFRGYVKGKYIDDGFLIKEKQLRL